MSNIIAVTGEGIVSAIGNDKASTLQSLREQRSGIEQVKYLDTCHHELPVGEVKLSNEELKVILGIDVNECISRTTLMGILAVRQALEDANITQDFVKCNNIKIALISGTTVGGMDIAEQRFNKFLQGQDLEYAANSCIGNSTKGIADYFNIFTKYTTISTACSSAANALILGANMIKAGEADIVVAGGSEALTKLHLNGFNSLMILDKKRCRPFDRNRNGLNLGEGAAYVVLESKESAQSRNQDIHAYLSGYANACDAFHQTASSENGDGAYLAMTHALAMANLKPGDIQYINAHGTGTPNNDASESTAILRVFSKTLPPVSSTKSFTGHTTSASGSIESVICLLAIKEQFVPANLGWKEQIEDGIYPSLGVNHLNISNVLCNSFGFGGNDSSVIFSRNEPKLPVNDFLKFKKDEIIELSHIEVSTESDLSEINKYVKPLEARRMGKLLKVSLLSSLKALDKAGLDKPDAIIMGTEHGCLENSERLLLQILEEGEVSLKPTCFMQCTHNTISSNIAIRTKCHGYNITYSQGADSFQWALFDAYLLLQSGLCKNVLIGYSDETTDTFNRIIRQQDGEISPSAKSVTVILSCGK